MKSDSPTAKRILIANVFGALNRGDAALIEMLVNDVMEVFGPETLISGIAFEPEVEERHLPNVTWHERIGKVAVRNLAVRRILNVALQCCTALYVLLGCPRGIWFPLPRKQRSAIQAIVDADLVISCAGGYLEDSNPSLLAASVQLLIATYYRRPLVMAPQSIGPIRASIIKRFVAAALRGAQLICVREEISEDFVLKDLRIAKSKVRHVPDLALYHDTVDMPGGRAALNELGLDDGAMIGCSVVSWTFPGHPDRQAAREDYNERLAMLLRMLWERYHRRILVFNQVSDDLPVARTIQKLAGDFVVVDTVDRTVPVIRGMICHMDYFVASRFHSCIFALKGSVPTSAFAYLPKSTGIMRALGLEERVYDIASFNPEQVLERIACDLEDPDGVRRSVREGIENYLGGYPTFRSLLRETLVP
jgi:colanic acid/amylovoran biosynthesis protein